jgi:hypothetical protein
MRTINIRIEIIELYAKLFREDFKKNMNRIIPNDVELKSTHFEKNEFHKQFRAYIREKLGEKLFFHPKNLYSYIFKPLRFKHDSEYNPTPWVVTKTFPQSLFRLIGIDDFKNFLDIHADELPEDVLIKQREYLNDYENRINNRNSLSHAYYCYISNTVGIKTAKLGIYDDNSLEMTLFQNKTNIEYKGKIENNTVCSFLSFKKNLDKFGNLSRYVKKSHQIPEVTFEVLTGEDFEKRIFLFGTYAAINDNEFDIQDPALVAGPVVLEKIDPEIVNTHSFREIPSITSNDINPIIAAQLSSKRSQINKPASRISRKSVFADRKQEELKFIENGNKEITNPDILIGNYLLLIPSDTHNALRKLVLTINKDLTIAAKAMRYKDYDDLIYYKGHVELFKAGLFSFRIFKDYASLDFLHLGAYCKSIHRPMFGYCSGIFKNAPKSSTAVIIRVSDEIQAITNTENPSFIRTNSTEFKALDNLLNLSDFFSGSSVQNEHINARNIIYEATSVYELLKAEKDKKFDYLSGVYEELYFDENEKNIRKDYLQINTNGTAFMIGRYRYWGRVQHKGSKMNLQFSSNAPSVFPVQYTLHIEENHSKLFSGIFLAVTEDNRNVTASKVYFRKIRETCDSEEDFFKRESHIIWPDSEEFKQLSQQFKPLITRLTGRIENCITAGKYDQNSANHIAFRKIALTLFNSACYLASKRHIKTDLKALDDLRKAFDHGFNDRDLLEQEMQENGALNHLASLIDIEQLRIQD